MSAHFLMKVRSKNPCGGFHTLNTRRDRTSPFPLPASPHSHRVSEVSRSLDEGMRKALRDLKPLFERNISSYKPEVLSFVGEKSIIAISESNIRNSHEVCGTFESDRRADIDTILNILKTAKSDVKLIIKSSLKLDIPGAFDGIGYSTQRVSSRYFFWFLCL